MALLGGGVTNRLELPVGPTAPQCLDKPLPPLAPSTLPAGYDLPPLFSLSLAPDLPRRTVLPAGVRRYRSYPLPKVHACLACRLQPCPVRQGGVPSMSRPHPPLISGQYRH